MNVLPAIKNKSGRRSYPPAVFLCLTGVFTEGCSALRPEGFQSC